MEMRHGLGVQVFHYACRAGQWKNDMLHGHGIEIHEPWRPLSVGSSSAEEPWPTPFPSETTFDFDKNRIDASFEKAIWEAAIARKEARVAREVAEQASLFDIPPEDLPDYSRAGYPRYEGQLRNGREHGHGVMIYLSMKPSGWPWRGGRPPNYPWDGLPPEEHWDGGRYEGQWINGERQGHGVHECADGSRYVGPWTLDKRNGHGVYVDANGNRHEVEFALDEPLIG